MACSQSQAAATIEMFFFPFVGGGHQIPMVDIARVFAAHGANSTILASPSSAPSFQKSIDGDQKSGRPISVHALRLPENSEPPTTDMSAPPFTDTSMLREPLEQLLRDARPDCVVVDVFHRWSAEVIDAVGVPRIVFNGNGCFSRCAQELMRIHKPQDNVSSEFEPFIVPNLPGRIEMTKSQLPNFMGKPHGGPPKPGYGVVVNSFYELEPIYTEFLRNELGNKAWLVGPVSLCNRNVEDKAVRGQRSSIDDQTCLNWLNSKAPNSVIYVSFGSLVRVTPIQLHELAQGLESSGQNFIWVVKKTSKSGGNGEDDEDESWVPDGFEQRIKETNKGLIIRGWAPQLLILEHPSVGGFMTHCGWNSTLEGVASGLPMVTFPISAEQFFNEKLITDVLGIGVKVGSMEWSSWDTEPKEPVGRDKVEAAVRRLMGGGSSEAAEMRRRARELGEKAKRAVEEGGSSYSDAEALVKELQLRKTDSEFSAMKRIQTKSLKY